MSSLGFEYLVLKGDGDEDLHCGERVRLQDSERDVRCSSMASQGYKGDFRIELGWLVCFHSQNIPCKIT